MGLPNDNSKRSEVEKAKEVLSFADRVCVMLEDERRKAVARSFELSSKVCSAYNEYLTTAPYYINIFAELNLKEPQTSSIIAALLRQKFKGKYEVLLSFIKTFLPKFPISLIHSPEIICEFRHIDICIKEKKKYAIIIENKAHWAEFQQRQIARYIESLWREGFTDEQIYVVIIPPNKEYDINVSCIWHKEVKHCGRCRNINREECDDGMDYRELFKDRFVNIPLYPNLFNWLKNIEIREADVSLKYAIQLLIEYIYYLQTNNYSIEEMKKIEDLIKEELNIGQDPVSDLSKSRKRLSELEEICDGLKSVISEIAEKSFIIYATELTHKYPNNKVLQRQVGSDNTVGVNIKIGHTNTFICIGVDKSVFVAAAPIVGTSKNENTSIYIKETIKPQRKINSNSDYYFWSYLKNDEDPLEVLYDTIALLQN